ncbi:uncharacterized protein LOC125456583 [Stegostoma tigrinum]|uniref:uncharacterized protein LOC125456583 n=1 Tax=Stegostoma tigrinum TaxID=3053191 RepID=UPI002870A500|nr:uncharacterized protein LOC125456583 [Stegostoma tigrinum]
MISYIQLIWPLAFCVAGISGDITMTQSPPVLSVGLGQTATLTCTASQSATTDVEWFQQQEGQKPSLLIYNAVARFTGREVSSTHFTLTISNVQKEDVADYYCQQSRAYPWHSDRELYKNPNTDSNTPCTDTYQKIKFTNLLDPAGYNPERERGRQSAREKTEREKLRVKDMNEKEKQRGRERIRMSELQRETGTVGVSDGGKQRAEVYVQPLHWELSLWFMFGKGTKLRLSCDRSQPKLTLLPPSPEQVQTKGTATLVCLANHFYPDELVVQWKKDGAVISDGVQTSTYSVSSLLTLSGSDWESNARFSCALTHVTLSSPLSKSIRRSECV